jgi:ABC-type antimicrobial peptide transport system permease subunit
VGVPFPAPPGATQSFTIHPSLSLAQVLGASALVLIMSLLAAIFPARFAARLDPIEALRRS